MKKEFYSAPEAANIFKVSRMAVVNWIRTGKLKADKVGRNYVIPHASIVEKLGQTIGEEKKNDIERTINRRSEEHSLNSSHSRASRMPSSA